MRRGALLVLLASLASLVTGCHKRVECEGAVSGAIDRMVEDAKGKMPPTAAANITRVVPQMKKVITAACIEDKWAPKVITCIDRARSKQELDACDGQLTPEQRVSERRRQDEILKSAVQPLDPTNGRPSPVGANGRPSPVGAPVDPHAGMNLGSAHP